MADCSCNNFPASLGNVTFQPGVKVGVGTTTPVGQLHVSNGDNAPDGLAGLELSNSAAGGGNWYIRAGATGTNTPAGGLSIANDSLYALAITNWGGIGVGTNAPNSKVHVSYADSAPNGLAGLEISNTASGGGNWYIRAGATGTNTPAGGLSIANDSIYGLVITSGGNVGIGKTAPAYPLDLAGTIRADGLLLGNMLFGGSINNSGNRVLVDQGGCYYA